MDISVSEEFTKLDQNFRNYFPCHHVELEFKSNNGNTIQIDKPNFIIDKIDVEKKPKMILKSASVNSVYEIVMLNFDVQRYFFLQ